MMLVSEPSPVFLEHKGVKIYYVFHNDFHDEGAFTYLYGLDAWCSCDDVEPNVFDIRDIKGYNPKLSQKENLMLMIDAGLLKNID